MRTPNNDHLSYRQRLADLRDESARRYDVARDCAITGRSVTEANRAADRARENLNRFFFHIPNEVKAIADVENWRHGPVEQLRGQCEWYDDSIAARIVRREGRR
jgi:hypothetical protein